MVNMFSAKSVGDKYAEITGIVHWINSEPIKISQQKNKVILIDFWTYSCINCIRTLPYLKSWDEKYRDKGLLIIGVHSPEFSFEKEEKNVEKAVEKFGIKYPVAMDNDHATWDAYGNNYWPRKYLIDKNGIIRYDHIGEGGYEETETKIQELLAELGKKVDMKLTKENLTVFRPLTPELYAGYAFARVTLGNEEGFTPNTVNSYNKPDKLQGNLIYLYGKWLNNQDNMEHADNNEAGILLSFTAASVNLVAGSDKNVEVNVKVNGKYLDKNNAGSDVKFDKDRSYFVVNEHRLYNVYNGDYGNFELDINSKNKFRFYAFTFGS